MFRIALVISLLVAASAQADTIQLGAAHDTMIFQNNVNNGAGGAPGFLAGTNSQPSIRRGMISFDVSAIPANATIIDVQLRLKIGDIAGSGGGGFSHPTIDLHKMLVSWGEANTGASTATVLSGTGQGNPALAGDATWNARFFDNATPTLWSEGSGGGKPGVDYSNTVSASLVQSDTLKELSVWLSTPQLVADVHSWLAAPDSNNGWMLINQNESAVQTFRGFYSRNFNPIPAPPDLATYFPQLIVDFVPPRFPGDTNGDNVVDFDDLNTLLTNYGLNGNFAAGDFDNSGTVDFADLNVLLTNYGSQAPTSLAILRVPEPGTLAIIALGALGLLIAVRRKQ